MTKSRTDSDAKLVSKYSLCYWWAGNVGRGCIPVSVSRPNLVEFTCFSLFGQLKFPPTTFRIHGNRENAAAIPHLCLL